MIAVRQRWFIGLLYRLTLVLAAGLGALVLVAPFIAIEPSDSWGWAWYLFAVDTVVRKTAVAAAIGLWVTAIVFFRPPRRDGLEIRPTSTPDHDTMEIEPAPWQGRAW